MPIKKHTQYTILLLLFVYVYTTLPVYGQSANQYLTKQVDEFNTHPSELIYFQTSKSIYETGEDLWFKSYQLDAQTFGFSDISKTLYLQMVNSADSVVWQEKYPIENGVVSGHVYLDEKLSEGDYSLEGYTKHSFYQNDTVGLIATRKIKIVKNISRLRANELPKDTTFRFDIFPEGGNLISGLSSNLAFKATDGRGNPVLFEGMIYQNDKSLCEIKSVHDGMGSVLFTPFQDQSYRIELNNGRSYPLPNVFSEGMNLRLSGQNKKQLDFVVSKSDNLPDGYIYLIGQMRGMICCVAKGILRDSLNISIPLENFLYQGIAEFTLYDSSMRPIAERLVYVQSEKKLYITAELEKTRFFAREKGTIKIKVIDGEGKPVKANLGISVFDAAYSNLADPINIMSYCYLSSQIRGNVSNPTYYFDERNDNRGEAIDLLLLTQGWRRYVWGTKDSDYKGQPFLTDEICGMQSVKVRGNKKYEPSQGLEQPLFVSGADGNLQFIWPDSKGHFMVDTEILKELRGGYVYLKPVTSKELTPSLELTDYFPIINKIKKYRQSYYPITDLSQPDRQYLSDLPIVSSDSTILLNEVTVVGKKGRLFRDKMMGRLDSLTQLNTNVVFVCGSCGFLLNYKSGYDAHHAVNDCPAKSMSPPIDGQTYPIAKFEHFAPTSKGIPFRLIDRQQVVYHANHYSEEELLKMNNLWRMKGYYAYREFYQPDEVDIQTSIPDPRNTLLWIPSAITDDKGEVEVSFYCSDVSTRFLGVVEGADGAGLLGKANCEFRVLRK